MSKTWMSALNKRHRLHARLEEGEALAAGAGGGRLEDLLGHRNGGELLGAGLDGGLVVRGGRHAAGLGRRELVLGGRKLLGGRVEIAHSRDLALLSGGLGGRLLVLVRAVRLDRVHEGLLQHVVVVLGVGLSRAQVPELALGL
eukprot:5291419-Heterocapsa_arctica.AAC.1